MRGLWKKKKKDKRHIVNLWDFLLGPFAASIFAATADKSDLLYWAQGGHAELVDPTCTYGQTQQTINNF